MAEKLSIDFKGKIRKVLKPYFVDAICKAGISSVLGRRYRGAGCVMMFHEITTGADDRLGLGCCIDDFESILSAISKRGYEFVSLVEAQHRLLNLDKQAKPFVALTFDDGYRDNIELALPVLEKFAAPCTIFVPTQMVTRQINAWWLALRELVTLHEFIDIEPLDTRFQCETSVEKNDLYFKLVDWVWQDFTRVDAFADTFNQYGIVMPDLVARLAMNAEEVKQADCHELISIGAHSVSHRALSVMSDEEALLEMTDNKKWLENLLQREVLHFAYPFGRPAISGQREAQLAKQVGFDLAVTTDCGNLFAEHGDCQNTFLWPRENGEFISGVESGIEWALNGTWRAFRSRFKDPKANLNSKPKINL